MLKFIIALVFALALSWELSIHVASVHSLLPVAALAKMGVSWLPVAFFALYFFAHGAIVSKGK